ncbi:MAG: serine/threonine-protein kinase, partial [Acidobacteriota bacterium]
MSEPPTRKLGRYEIRKELGKGAMGAVYLARDTLLERDVALKVMASATTSDPDLKQRFEREAKAVARLQHSNIVTVYDLGYDEAGSPFIAMEFLQGRDLEQIIQKDPPPLPQKLDIIVKVCRGLAHAHGHGIIHRDVKPANIFVTTGGETKIMDFGVARLAQSSQTRTGMILGTADYMAPEQISGQRVDARADIFSLGVVLYRLLTQKKPFAGESMQAVFYKILNVDPPALALPGSQALPELQGIVGRALAKDPAARFQTADEMAGAIEGFLRRHPEALSKGGAFALAAAPGAGLGPESAEATPARKTTLPPESVPLGAAAGAGPVGAPSGPGESTAAPGTAALKPP